MEKTKLILTICGIAAIVFLAIAILLHGFGISGHMMRSAAPYAYTHGGHGGFGYHH